ncbi:MAG TPA: glycosyltransferase, partial [Kiloniellaceae bacterium]|nr:glycosyltransferase [Kiloniellaceae bacterium]
IAHALVERHKDLSVLIISGSPIIGSFDFKARVDFVRVPGVIKLRNGDYTSLALHIDVEQTMAMRASIIEHTAEVFDPDLFIVDKEPLGLRGEVEATLKLLRERGTPCVLGLRDVMDEPGLLAPEWERKQVVPALQRYFDDIWVYGLPQICDPLEGIDLPGSVRKRMTYTGYLKRSLPRLKPHVVLEKIEDPFLLVTVGGGGDGEAIIDWVLRAYESDPKLPYPALLVLGPFMNSENQADFLARAGKLANVEAVTFETHLESLMDRAVGVVCMGGYNTFCEVLSFDKRALVIPRTEPRMEQHIRASRAQDLGLVRMLHDDGSHDATQMATALRNLPQQRKPSEVVVPGLLDGPANVVRLADYWLKHGSSRLTVADTRSKGRR